MRIAFISIGDPRDVRVWSGIPYFVMKEFERQAEAVELIAPLQRRFKYLYAPWMFLRKLRGSQLHFDRHPFALRNYARQIERHLKDKKVDAIFSMTSVPIAALRTNIPVFFWTDAVLENMVDYYPGPFSGMDDSEIGVGHRQEQAALDRVKVGIYSSSWAERVVRERYRTTPDGVAVIEFGANLDIDHDLAFVESLVEKRRMQEFPKLLFVGVDWERKGGSIALEATRILNERGIPCTLQVAGCTAPESPYIEHLGFISKATEAGKQRLKVLLSEASFFLFPTRAEAAGIVFAEASAFGLPILTTDTGGVGSYVVSAENGFAFSPDAGAETYANAIQRMLGDADLYRQLSLGGYSRYFNVLNWSTGVQKLLHLMAEHLGEPKPC